MTPITGSAGAFTTNTLEAFGAIAGRAGAGLRAIATRSHATPQPLGRLIGVLCSAQFFIVLDFSIVSIALPSIGSDIAFGAASLQWVLSAYALTFGGLLLVCGRAGDLFGHRYMLVIGLWILALSTIAAGLSSSPMFMVASRAVQGVGAACAAPAALSLITLLHKGEARYRALAAYGTAMTVGFVLGVLLGGVITFLLSWRYSFFFTAPLIAAVALAARRVVPARLRVVGHPSALEMPAAATATGAITFLLVAVVEVARPSPRVPEALLALVLAIMCGFAFVFIEHRSRAPLITPQLARRRALVVATGASMLTVASGVGMTFVLTLQLQRGLGFTALGAGCVFAGYGFMALIGGRSTPRLLAATGPASALSAGLSIQAASALLLALNAASGSLLALVIGIAFFGLGHVVASISASALAVAGLCGAQHGVANGILTTGQQLGAAMGPALLILAAGLFVGDSAWLASDRDSFLASVRVALVAACGLALFGAILPLTYCRATHLIANADGGAGRD